MIFGSQPSFSLALDGSPNNVSTSESKVFYDTYHEYVDSIFSEASVIENEEALIFSYSLSKDKTIQEPFAALFFHKKDSLHSFFNLTKFDSPIGSRILPRGTCAQLDCLFGIKPSSFFIYSRILNRVPPSS